MKRRSIWFVLSAAVLIVAVVGLPALRTKPPQPTLVGANGYDDFLAANAFRVPNTGDWKMQEIAELRTFVQQNSNALALIRAALDKQWAVPISYDTKASATTNLASIKTTAHLFCAIGRIAELEQRTNHALRAYSDCARFGHKSGAGGLMLHHLVGLACESLAMREAQRVYFFADDETLREFSEKLSVIDRSRESVEAFIARDKDWSRGSQGWYRTAIQAIPQWRLMRETRQRIRYRHQYSEADLRLLRTDCALVLYHRENGRYPMKLDELIPRYLESVTRDPFSGKAMVYRRLTNSYALYSIGPDRIDDGGKPLNRPAPDATGDLLSSPPPAL